MKDKAKGKDVNAAAKRKDPTPDAPGDRPPGILRHGRFTAEQVGASGTERDARRLRRLHPVERMKSMKAHHIAAAFEFQSRYELAHSGPGCVILDHRVDTTQVGGDHAAVMALDSQRAYRELLAHVPQTHRYLFIQVVGLGKSLRGVIGDSKRPQRRARGVLRDTLETVAKALGY